MSKQTEAMKLALEGAANYIDALGGDSRKYRQALAEQPAQQEPGRNHWEDGDVFERIGAMKKQPAQPQQEPVALKWQQAPVKTQWGDDMVVASVAIDKDHTVCLYCERDQAPKVDAMFAQRKPLTDDEIESINVRLAGSRDLARLFARAIEAAHSIKEQP